MGHDRVALLRRQFATARPPDAASRRAGQELCREWLEQASSAPPLDLPPCVARSFYQSLTKTILDVRDDSDDKKILFLHHLHDWILQIPAEASAETKHGLVQALAAWVHQRKDPDRLLQTLSNISAELRVPLTQALVHHVAREPRDFRWTLSPVLAAALVVEPYPRLVMLQTLWKCAWFIMTADVLYWLTESLSIFLADRQPDAGLAHLWLTEVLQLAQAMSLEDYPQLTKYELSTWLYDILRNTVPRVCHLDTTRGAHSLWEALAEVMPRVAPMSLDNVLVCRLATLALVLPSPLGVVQVLQLFAAVDRYSLSVMNALMSILRFEHAQEVALLYKKIQDMDLLTTIEASEYHLLHTFYDEEPSDLFALLTNGSAFQEKLELEPSQQLDVLYIIFMLFEQGDDSSTALAYTNRLLSAYPHLAVFLLPVFIDRTQLSCKMGEATQFLDDIELLCALAVDPHCAQEIWNMVGIDLIDPERPLSVRIAMIRLYGPLCQTNRRLYSRIIQTLGNCVIDKQVEIRLAAAATILDLAEKDLIRDMSDVIGWIQDFLGESYDESPKHALLVHFALLSLHHMIVADELDFDVVMKVLHKRMTGMADPFAAMKMPVIVLEPLALLLGDGERYTDKDDNIGDEAISPQISRAVILLLEMGQYASRQLYDDGNLSQTSRRTFERVLENVFMSLSMYSFPALGFDVDAVKESLSLLSSEGQKPSAASFRYSSVVGMVDVTMMVLSSDTSRMKVDAIIPLAKQVSLLEEDALGTSLWLKQGTHGARGTKGHLEPLISLLPSGVKLSDRVQSKATCAQAISILLSSTNTDLSSVRDYGDACLETDDNLVLLLVTQSFVVAAARCLSKRRTNLYDLISEIKGWYEVYVSPDTMYMILAALVVHLPPSVDNAAEIVEDTQYLISNAYRDGNFEKTDISRVCLGLIGVACSRHGMMATLEKILSMLQDSVRGYGGKPSFGAFFAIGLVCQALRDVALASKLEDIHEPTKKTLRRACGFLLEELLACFESSGAAQSLLSCLKAGVDCPKRDLKVLASHAPGTLSLLMTKHVFARHAFFGCAIGLPCLVDIDEVSPLACARVFDLCEWGTGKGLAVSPLVRRCRVSGLMDTSDFDAFYNRTSEAFDRRLRGARTSDIDDIFYVLSTCYRTASKDVMDRLGSMKINMLDDDGAALSLYASVSRVLKLPGLSDAPFFSAYALRQGTTKEGLQLICQVVADAADIGNQGTKYSDIGIILQGCLAAVRNEKTVSWVYERGSPQLRSPSSVSRQEASIMSDSPLFDSNKVPMAVGSSLLSKILGTIDEPGVVQGSERLRLVLGSIELLSLPPAYAQQFLGPLMLSTQSVYKIDVARVLLSQVSIRRKAVFDAQEFINAATRFCALPTKDWAILLRQNIEAVLLFVQGLHRFVPKFPIFSLERAMSSLWASCLSSTTDQTSLAVALIRALCRICKEGKIAGNGAVWLRNFVLKSVVPDSSRLPTDIVTRAATTDEGSDESIVNALGKCLGCFDIEELRNDGLLSFQVGSRDVAADAHRAMFLLELVKSNFFADKNDARCLLMEIASWSAKSLASAFVNDSAASDAVRRCIFAIATLRTEEPLLQRNDQIRSLFETLLLSPPSAYYKGVDWLGTTLSTWCEHRGALYDPSLSYLCGNSRDRCIALSSESIDTLMTVLVFDLPYSMCLFAGKEKMSSVLFSQLHRLLLQWENKTDDTALLETLRQMALHCRPPKSLTNTDLLDNKYLKLCSDALLSSVSREDPTGLPR